MIDFEATILSEYANSPTIRQLIANMNAYIDPRVNIDNFFNFVWNVDTAFGNGLDIWGRIVGVGRVLNLPSFSYFGFEGPGPAASGLPWNQAIFYGGGAPLTTNYALLDDPYRVLILAKALANISNATIPAINQILINVFSPTGLFPVAGNSYCTDGLDMTMTYTFGSALDPVQHAIVYQSGVLPTPAGVSFTIVEL